MRNATFHTNSLPSKSVLLKEIIFPSVDQIKTISNTAKNALYFSAMSVSQEIQKRGAKNFVASIAGSMATTMAFKSLALAALGTSAPTILGVTAAAMVGRGGLELTKFGAGRLKNYYYGVSQPALFSYETAQEIKSIGVKATFGLAASISFIKNNRKNMSLTQLFTGAAKKIGTSGAVSLFGIGTGYGLGMAFSDTLTPVSANAHTLDNLDVTPSDVIETVEDVNPGPTEAIIDNAETENPESQEAVSEIIEPVEVAEAIEESTINYQVQKGDNLWGIVQTEYDLISNSDIVDLIEEVKELNGFSDYDADNLARHQNILLPTAEDEIDIQNVVRPIARPDDLVPNPDVIEEIEPQAQEASIQEAPLQESPVLIEPVELSFNRSNDFKLDSDFNPDSYYLGEVEYSVRPGDGMWKIFTNHYDTSGMSNSEIRGYVDALSEYNNMSGTAASNLEIGDKINLPDQKLLFADGVLTQNWSAMDQQARASVASSRFQEASNRVTSCNFVFSRELVTASNSCGLKSGDSFIISPTQLFQPSI